MEKITSFEQIDAAVRGFAPARVILTSVYIDVYTKIGDVPKSSRELASENDWDLRGTTILLDALCALGLLNKKENLYTNSEIVSIYLRKDKPTFKGWGILHRNTMWLGWSNLTSIVTKDDISRPSNLHNKEFNKYFINAMHEFHYEEAFQIADLLNIEKVKKVADLAGGPGSYTLAFAKKNQNLKGVIVDLQNTLQIAKQNINDFGMSDRISTHVCDLFKDDLNIGNDFDLILISNLFHAASEKDNKALLKKVYPCLVKGGRVVINEIPIDDTKTSPLDGALFSVNMLVQTEGGDTYPQSQLMSWLQECGFKPSILNDKLTIGTK